MLHHKNKKEIHKLIVLHEQKGQAALLLQGLSQATFNMHCLIKEQLTLTLFDSTSLKISSRHPDKNNFVHAKIKQR